MALFLRQTRGAYEFGLLMHDDLPFWKTKSLAEMTQEEWESLCDGCGRCCLLKLEDEDTEEIVYTRLACKLLDIGACRCKSYETRREKVPDCVQLTPEAAKDLAWLPPTCAYRLVARGEDLAWWHPLVSGDAETVHEAGISVRDYAVSEKKVKNGRYEAFLLKWG
jgi:uncharacterized cysteine cluster protein YcgN (CxxCxxCC family)